jgi:acyl dehydratase
MPEMGASAERTKRVAERDIELFAEITGDRNPLHFDAEAARRSVFGGLIVQGVLPPASSTPSWQRISPVQARSFSAWNGSL